MADLVEQFFKRDMTEAEDQALSELLLNSQEAADGFVQRAQEAYSKFGFPEPEWPLEAKPFNRFDPGAKSWFGSWMLLLALGALLTAGGTLAYKHFASSSLPGKESLKGKAKTTPSGTRKHSPAKNPGGAREASNPSGAETTKDLKPEKPGADLAPGKGKTGEDVKALSPGPKTNSFSPGLAHSNQGHPAATPVNLDQNPGKEFSNLSVIVDQPVLGFLTVRVLNPQGKEATLLYRGNLKPGSWAFQWDGHLSDGKPAPAGEYKIEIKSGSISQHKTVLIQ